MNARSTKADEGYRGNVNGARFLNGKTILLVEDEFLLALQLEELLQSRGGIVRGPYRGLDEAMQAAQREAFDFAILDINLGGTMVYPLADQLLARGTPLPVPDRIQPLEPAGALPSRHAPEQAVRS
jgi:PleD family two-component response regulator